MKKQEVNYKVVINGMPNYAAIPKVTLEPIAKKFLENILKQIKEQKTGD